MTPTIATALFGLAMFGLGAIITGLFWAAAYKRIEDRHLLILGDRDLFITRAAELTRANQALLDDLRRAGVSGATRTHLRRVK